MINILILSLWILVSGQSYLPSGTAIALPTGDELYQEKNDTYYLLFKFKGSPPYSWDHASIIVKGYRHKGREGFLAKVDDIDTHYLLAALMGGSEAKTAWIGLEVICDKKAYSRWTDQTLLEDQVFRAWGPNSNEYIRKGCRKQYSRLPVFYQKTDVGLRWAVGSDRSNQEHILVAFPPPQSQEN